MEDYNHYYSLDDFLIESLDPYILLRLFCENSENLKYNLEWQYIDIIESGWASYQDIEEFDKKTLLSIIINYMENYNCMLLEKTVNIITKKSLMIG
ncbi:HEPN/Toprim-associated domain-containing protein [Enterococcus sp. DIV0086]|uniref:HEPN/Toprim-associated domain-containing protein n=1 Tax=Enterococcus sp. DIV0086 TaxID=2774655 RepID=UPI003D27C75D